MSLFSRKNKKTKYEAGQVLGLLMTSKIDQMINSDTVINLLIQKGVFTKEEFYAMKQTVNNTGQYQKIKELSDNLVASFDSEIGDALTDDEIDSLLKTLDERGK